MRSSRCELNLTLSQVLPLIIIRDWKKLTFYYFADSYINFNPLVTDLFKIYKTRIWMSAINPASFVTPVAGLQLPSGLGTCAFNPEADSYALRKQTKPAIGYPMTGTTSPPQGPFDIAASGLPFPHIYPQNTPSDLETHQPEQPGIDYHGTGQHLLNLQARYAAPPYQFTSVQHPGYGPQSNGGIEGARKSHLFRDDWNQQFQGLSLGS